MSLVTQLIKKYKVIAEEEDQPQEDDAYLSPTGALGSKTSLTIDGKFIGEFESDEKAEEAINEWVKKNNFFPNVWYVSDHGNVHPYTMKTDGL